VCWSCLKILWNILSQIFLNMKSQGFLSNSWRHLLLELWSIVYLFCFLEQIGKLYIFWINKRVVSFLSRMCPPSPTSLNSEWTYQKKTVTAGSKCYVILPRIWLSARLHETFYHMKKSNRTHRQLWLTFKTCRMFFTWLSLIQRFNSEHTRKELWATK